jgi:hypothetical protein
MFFIASGRIFEVLRVMRGPARIEVCPGWALKRVPTWSEGERKKRARKKEKLRLRPAKMAANGFCPLRCSETSL